MHLLDKQSSVFKLTDERRTTGSDTERADTSCDSAVSGGVCEQRDATKRVLSQSRFEPQHSGSPPEEAAVEKEDDEERARRWEVLGSGIGPQETTVGAATELRAGRCLVGRTADRSAARF
jgi:hypothetical protein